MSAEGAKKRGAAMPPRVVFGTRWREIGLFDSVNADALIIAVISVQENAHAAFALGFFGHQNLTCAKLFVVKYEIHCVAVHNKRNSILVA